MFTSLLSCPGKQKQTTARREEGRKVGRKGGGWVGRGG